MKRVPEPELMGGAAQARAYAEADFGEPNGAFVERLERGWAGASGSARVCDLGCGPADIPARLAVRHPAWRIDAVDGSEAMLAHARERLARDGLQGRVTLVRADLARLPLPDRAYDAVLSNSLLHHLHQPARMWQAVRRLGKPGARVLVMDLARPAGEPELEQLVERYALGAPDVLRSDFAASLRAAFTLDEAEAQLQEAGLGHLRVERTSDRHLVIDGTL